MHNSQLPAITEQAAAEVLVNVLFVDPSAIPHVVASGGVRAIVEHALYSASLALVSRTLDVMGIVLQGQPHVAVLVTDHTLTRLCELAAQDRKNYAYKIAFVLYQYSRSEHAGLTMLMDSEVFATLLTLSSSYSAEV